MILQHLETCRLDLGTWIMFAQTNKEMMSRRDAGLVVNAGSASKTRPAPRVSGRSSFWLLFSREIVSRGVCRAVCVVAMMNSHQKYNDQSWMKAEKFVPWGFVVADGSVISRLNCSAKYVSSQSEHIAISDSVNIGRSSLCLSFLIRQLYMICQLHGVGQLLIAYSLLYNRLT